MVLVLGLRSEREVRGSKIRDGEGQSWAGGMVRRNLGRQGQVFREADACCTASTAAPAAERKRWEGGERDRERKSVLQYRTETVQRNTPPETTQLWNIDLPRLMLLLVLMAVETVNKS